MICTLPLLLLALLPIALHAQAQVSNSRLIIVEAGFFNHILKKEIPLTPGKVVDFCPKTYSVKGFSIDCRGHGVVAPVSFSVNGKPIRTELVPPYTLAGDYNMFRFPWTSYTVPGQMTVTCKSPDLHPHSAIVRFRCASQTTKPTEPPYAPATAPSRGCIVINASNYLGPLSPRWTHEVDGSMTYRKGDPFIGVEAPGISPLVYSFVVKQMSQYAITIDMTTRGYSEHNDVFLRFTFGGGLMLQKPGSLQFGGKGYLKAYHNKNRRATEAYSIDNDAHSFYTKSVLPPGKKLYITIGARSTRVTVHRIVMFPCSGGQCMAYNSYWQRMVKKCI